jgi:uncharacterized protein
MASGHGGWPRQRQWRLLAGAFRIPFVTTFRHVLDVDASGFYGGCKPVRERRRGIFRTAMTRTRLLPLLASIGALALVLGGCSARIERPPPGAVPGPALWSVADEDTTIYLFGTVHALPPEAEWMRPGIAEALAASDTLVTEVELDAASLATMQQTIMLKGTLPQEQTLRGLLTDEQRAKYEAALTRIDLKPETFDRFEPWYAAMMMTMLPLIKEGYSTEAGVEKVLGTASGEGKKREALETVDYQLTIFDTLPQDAQIRYLMEVIEGNQNIKALLDAIVAEWLEGDADELARLMNEGLTDAELAERLLYARNRNWADWIAERMKRPGTLFMAVGAGHLAGENSVQDALVARGITAARVQ